jgi:hypothetical protein
MEPLRKSTLRRWALTVATATMTLWGLTSAAGCGPAAQTPVSYPLYGVGTGGVFMVGSWQITLDVALVGLGPIYFCTTAGSSSELCPTSLNEFADVAVVDMRNPTPQLLGEVRGVTGEIRSVGYDLAYNWFPRQTAPTASAVAPEGHSAHFEGRATGPEGSFRFVADVDVLPPFAGLRAIRRTTGVSTRIDDSALRLDIRLDPQSWWKAIDFSALWRASAGMDPVLPVLIDRTDHNVVFHDTLVAQITTGSGASTFLWSPTGP